MSRLATAFGIQPPIYLDRGSDNTAIFPIESTGQFNSTALTFGDTYDVHGTEPTLSSSSGTRDQTGTTSLFGSYPLPHPPPVHAAKKREIKKVVILASLSAGEQSSSAWNHIQYSVVTQVTVSPDPARGQCTPKVVCEKVKEQVGFDVTLLDSKCYPLMSTENTCDPDFWLIAASKSMYEKLGGVPAETDWSTGQ